MTFIDYTNVINFKLPSSYSFEIFIFLCCLEARGASAGIYPWRGGVGKDPKKTPQVFKRETETLKGPHKDQNILS